MRIVNLEEFRALPSGTVFRKYTPQMFQCELSIKGETWPVDFLVNYLTGNVECDKSEEEDVIFNNAEKDSKYSIPLEFDSYGRDGSFDEEQLFGVYEQKDLDGLINALKECRGV